MSLLCKLRKKNSYGNLSADAKVINYGKKTIEDEITLDGVNPGIQILRDDILLLH